MEQRNLSIRNQYMFNKVLTDEAICKAFLERVLRRPIDALTYKNAEQAIEPKVGAKGVRLDLFAKSEGATFDIELQAEPKLELARRYRYYQSAIDTASLGKGDDYENLPESFIIFVCDHDPFGCGLPVYTLQMRCAEDDACMIGSGFTWLAMNCPAYRKERDSHLASVMGYISADIIDASDRLVCSMAEAVEDANKDRKWVDGVFSVSTIEEDLRREIRIARKVGLREGEAQGLEKGVAQGRQEGLVQGEIRFGQLADRLLDADRLDDLKRATADATFRDVLFAEFGI